MLTGSMTGGGRFLSISQPAVTRLIRELEEDLKLELFAREGSHILPTPQARALFKEVERHFAGTEKIREAAYAIRDFKCSRIKVAANLSISLTCLPAAVARFKRLYPQSVISVRSGVSAEIIDLVSSGSVDIGFAAVQPGRRDVGTVPLEAAQWYCMIPSGHPLASLSQVAPKDLHGVDFLSVGPSSMSRHALDAILQAAGALPRVQLEAQYSVTAASFVCQGLGVALVDPLAASHFQSPQVVLKPFAPAIPYVLSVVHPYLAKPEGPLEVFSQLLGDVYAQTVSGLQAQFAAPGGAPRARRPRPAPGRPIHKNP